MVRQTGPAAENGRKEATESRAGRGNAERWDLPTGIPASHTAMDSKLNIATQGEHTQLSDSESPTWRKGHEFQNHFSLKHSCHWPCITPSNTLLWWPDSIHLGEKHPSQAGGFLPGGEFISSGKGHSSCSSAQRNGAAVEKEIPLSDQLSHLVQSPWQEHALVVLVHTSKKITMQNWHIYHLFKMEFVTHQQMKFYFPHINTNTLVSSWSLGILTLKRREKASCGGEQTDSQLVIWFLFQKPPPHAIL